MIRATLFDAFGTFAEITERRRPNAKLMSLADAKTRPSHTDYAAIVMGRDWASQETFDWQGYRSCEGSKVTSRKCYPDCIPCGQGATRAFRASAGRDNLPHTVTDHQYLTRLHMQGLASGLVNDGVGLDSPHFKAPYVRIHFKGK